MDKEKIIQKFKEIKNKGFVKSRRGHNTGIGKTFEDLLGVKENNDKAPDFAGFEVKSQRMSTNSYMTLFTKSPQPRGINQKLRDKFGENYLNKPNLKKLHVSIFANRYSRYREKYSFRILNNKEKERVEMIIIDLETNEKFGENIPFWTYASLEKCLQNKLKGLFYVNAVSKVIGSKEHFKYTSAKIYIDPSLSKFLNLLDQGKLMIDIRIGSYKTGKRKGRTHDHGTAFRIKSTDLEHLYNKCLIVD